MPKRIASILRDIRALERDLEAELQRRQRQLRYTIRHRRVIFDLSALREHRAHRTPLWRYLLTARPHFYLTAPIIYGMIVPLVLLDLFATLYQWLCFPMYGIARVPRCDYFIYDRASLAYLNLAEKLNCLYCSYANGLAAYLREIGARTEQYWCPIKHARALAGAHGRYGEFVDYGDARGYRRGLKGLQEKLRPRRASRR